MNIKLENVYKIYNKGLPNEVNALKNITLEVEKATINILFGRSGSGKTTLLNLIGCVSRPTSGRVQLLGKEVSKLSEKFLTFYRRNYIGFLFQSLNLLADITVYENIILPIIPAKMNEKDAKDRAFYLMEEFDIAHKADFMAAELSGGEQQRVSLCRSLMHDPPILLVDEPTAHLDSALASDFLRFIGELKEEGKTLILSTHDQKIINWEEVDKKYQMIDGNLQESN